MFLVKYSVMFLLSSISILAHSQVKVLEDLKWEKRVVLIFASDGFDENLIAQQEILKNDKEGYAERDLVVLTYLLADKDDQALRQKYNIQKNQFTFLLIGKDGGQKLIKNEVVKSKDLFDLIDSMPMRQSEMRRRK